MCAMFSDKSGNLQHGLSRAAGEIRRGFRPFNLENVAGWAGRCIFVAKNGIDNDNGNENDNGNGIDNENENDNGNS